MEVKRSIQESTEKAEEQRDKESRRNNIILYNVPESAELRAEERNKADIAFCLQLFNNCLNTGMVEEDFVNVLDWEKRGYDKTIDDPVGWLQLYKLNYGIALQIKTCRIQVQENHCGSRHDKNQKSRM